MKTKKSLINLNKLQVALFVLLDIVFSNAAMFFGIYIRYGMTYPIIPIEALNDYGRFILINSIVTVIVFILFKLYNNLWRYASFGDAVNIVCACTVVVIVDIALCFIFGCTYLPRSAYIIMYMIFMILTVANRFADRSFRWVKITSFSAFKNMIKSETSTDMKNILVIGAGQGGKLLIEEIENSRFMKKNRVVCVIDDDPKKIGMTICGVKIVGNRWDIASAVERFKVHEIIFAIPSASATEKAEMLNLCKETGCTLKTLPGVYQLVNGEVKLSNIRQVVVEDLLGREPIKIDIKSVMAYVKDKIVMVTGGGGSIGSELCRQIALLEPKMLVIFDIYENNAYSIQNELKRKMPQLNLVTIIGSVRDEKRLDYVFDKYRPDIVYHAAAHKHVPLMEESPNEAIKNNVFGTYKTVRCADKYKVKKFVLISTDKAVNPTNIMGASKRMCEMIVQGFNGKSETDFVAVRFGNVLASNGSVIPIFEQQIKEGGPVTVTHPDIIRYFMTIPEAVSLVLQAGAYATGGEIFILDMGKPVKILDLAKNIIRLNGYVPDVDMEIKFIGLRPGEKLYEELLMNEEGIQNTENKLIHIGKPIEFDVDRYFKDIDNLKEIMENEDTDIRDYIKKIVPTYITPDEANKMDDASVKK